MKTITEIHHPECKVSVFLWNRKYLIKIEQPDLEQTFKIPLFDIAGDEAVIKMITEDFIQSVLKRFQEMRTDLRKLINS